MLPCALCVLAASGPALAVDLKVDGITVVQSVQLGSTALVGGRSAMVRAEIGVLGAPGSVAGVDARLTVLVDGVEVDGSPFYSVNGPILAPLSPNLATLDHTVNFQVVIPQSADVDFIVEVDPAGAIAESNESNNVLSLLNQVFVCRDIVDLTYVAVDYTPGGGLPDAALVEPGIGDGFTRAIFAPREFNYHRSPLGPLTWTQGINGSDNALLNTLKDLLVAQIPAAGYMKPDFIYGWLPGNPYSGNGKAIGIPGDAAFGNTQLSRFQRTFAHEIGHLVGLTHNSATVGTTGIDVEHHLLDTEVLPQTFPSTKFDVMVAGKLTKDAFVTQASFNTFLSSAKVACAPGAPSAPWGGEDDSPGSMLRVSGEILHGPGTVTLDPIVRIDSHTATSDDPSGDLLIVARNAAGVPLWEVRADTQRTREPCGQQEGMPPVRDASPFHVLIPQGAGNAEAADEIASVDVVRVATGALLATRTQSASAPIVEILSVEAVAGVTEPQAGGHAPGGPGPAQPLSGLVRVTWSASDADGDALSHFLFYSPDNGLSWLPIAVRLVESLFEFDAQTIPSTLGLNAKFFVRSSDGFQSTDSPVFEAAALGGGTPPDVHLLTPNDGSIHRQHSTVLLHGSGWDLEDQYLPESAVSWVSSLDGALGLGRLLAITALSPGVHTITVTGIDSTGMSSSREVAITVLPRAVMGPDLNLDGIVDGVDLGLLLAAWGTDLADLNGSGVVDGADIGVLLGRWGQL
jgi:hypothetical protein